MQRRLPVDGVAAARQRDQKPLPDLNQIRIRNVVGRGDIFVRHEPAEIVASDRVESIAGLHGVDRAAGGGSGAGGAGARDGDADGGSGGDGGGGAGGRRQVVGGEEAADGFDGEEGFDGGVGRWFGRDEAD